ncbi:hypothetical protein [Thalassoglobus sp.]
MKIKSFLQCLQECLTPEQLVLRSEIGVRDDNAFLTEKNALA